MDEGATGGEEDELRDDMLDHKVVKFEANYSFESFDFSEKLHEQELGHYQHNC